MNLGQQRSSSFIMQKNKCGDESPEPSQSGAGGGFVLTHHIAEIRRRIIRVMLLFLVIFIGLYPFATKIYHYISLPLLNVLPPGGHMIAVTIASPFTGPLKLIFILSLLACVPFISYQLWCFIAPGLYRKERYLFGLVAFFGMMLFYLGMAMTYFLLCPMVFHFFVAKTPVGVEFMVDIHHYINFLLTISLAVGLVFETPLVVLLLVSVGLFTHAGLAKQRRYVFVICFVVAMLIAPPEVSCQVLVAVPMYALFEVGLLLARWMRKA